jgi:hypothetical protein
VKIETDIELPDRRPIIVDLCAGSGAWSQPYADSGLYDVRRFDLEHGTDVRLLEAFDVPIHGILAAPPCTVFARAGNTWPRTTAQYREGLSVVDACLRIIIAGDPVWWALENPSGTLRKWLGEPRLRFDPCDYGDPYTKRTCLWGTFTQPRYASVEPSLGSLMHRKIRDPRLRSVTPPGFARAFYRANP